jgi:hypothetical protein
MDEWAFCVPEPELAPESCRSSSTAATSIPIGAHTQHDVERRGAELEEWLEEREERAFRRHSWLLEQGRTFTTYSAAVAMAP